MNKQKKGYVMVLVDALTQKRAYEKLKNVKLDPEDENSPTLGTAIKNIVEKQKEQDKKIVALEKENKKLKEGLGKTLRALELLNLKK